MEILPLRGLRYDLRRVRSSLGDPAQAVTSPPYDVLSPQEHRKLLGASPHNITWITLGSTPGGVSSYEDRRLLLEKWRDEGVLAEEREPCFYLYSVRYAPKGEAAQGGGKEKLHFLGLVALGKLHPFEEGVVLPHEKTFSKVVDDRSRLLDATGTHLESILLLYSDPRGEIDGILQAHLAGEPAISVEAKPGEVHALYPLRERGAMQRLVELFEPQKPIIADGHHRYTTALKYASSHASRGPGFQWQLMTFANLHSSGVQILGTHRLVKLRVPGKAAADNLALDPGGARRVAEVVDLLSSRLERTDDAHSDLRIETRDCGFDARFPDSVREGRKCVARTSYALFHDVIVGEWLAPFVDPSSGIHYYKEATGEREALASGEGDILFRMKPVARSEFESVVQGGDVLPHKTTYFYPKLWSGLVLWPVGDVRPAGS